MRPILRNYQNDNDYWRIRQFLREVFLLNGLREISWHVARWDYWRWPGVESWGDGPLEQKVFIWEQPDGQIIAILNSEEHGDAFLQVHPGYRTPKLETELLDAAEKHLAVISQNGLRKLCVWADSRDALRQDILKGRGYTQGQCPETQHRRDLSLPVPDFPVAQGFTMRSLGDVSELPARGWFSWKAFHPDEPEERYTDIGWQWYLNIQRCPLYRRDLDLVAIAPNGDIASFCTIWYDDVTRSAYFEPVGACAPYQRRGLARAVMAEGLRRVQRLGAMIAFVGGYSPEANALYASVMGSEHDLSERWVKEF